MTMKEQIQARMGTAADRWYFVALQMTGQRPNYAYVMMHVIERLHETGGDSVRISIPEWRAALGFAKDLVGNASMTLRKIGVIYENHGRITWRIDEAKFWAAFEEAFGLVFPDFDDYDDDDDDDYGAGEPHMAGEPHPSDSDDEGKTDSDVAGEPPLIDRKEIKKNEGDSGMALFERYRLKFTGSIEACASRLVTAVSKLGLSVAREVIQRCLKAGGRTWVYVAKALDNEAKAVGQLRQLNLMPVDVPSAKTAKKSRDESGSGLDWKSLFGDGGGEPEVSPVPPVARSAAVRGKYAEVWRMAYDQMRLQDKNKFEQYLRDARLVAFDSGEFVVETANDYARDMLQHRLYRWVAGIVSTTLGATAKLKFVAAQPVGVAV